MELRRGDNYYDLTEAQYAIWLLGFRALNREELVATGVEEGIAEEARLVRELDREGLFVELRDEPPLNRPLLETHRLLPVGRGLGNSPEQPESFVLAPFGGEPRLTVDVRVYLVWGLSTRPVSVASACHRVAAMFGVDERPVLDQLAVNLPVLLRHGMAVLDAA
jgi:hypothetical protein